MFRIWVFLGVVVVMSSFKMTPNVVKGCLLFLRARKW